MLVGHASLIDLFSPGYFRSSRKHFYAAEKTAPLLTMRHPVALILTLLGPAQGLLPSISFLECDRRSKRLREVDNLHVRRLQMFGERFCHLACRHAKANVGAMPPIP